MKKRRAPKTMSEALDFLLRDLCVDLGFCLPPVDVARICAQESWDADAFTVEVFRAEGMDPDDFALYRKMRNRFIAMFGAKMIDREAFELSLKCDE